MRRWRLLLLAVPIFLAALAMREAVRTAPAPTGPPPAPADPARAAAPTIDPTALPAPPPAIEPGPAIPPPSAPEPGAGAAPAPVVLLPKERLVIAPRIEGADIEVRLRPVEGTGREITAKVGADGAVSVPAKDLAPGLYEVEVTAVKDGVLVRAKQTLPVGEGPADLSAVELTPKAGVRARVVDAGDTPVPQAQIVVVRPEEEAERGRRIAPGEGGWVTYADLEPGVDHRLVVYGLPEPLEQVVRVPYEPAGMAEVTIRWPEWLVRVTLAFATADGAEREAPKTLRLRLPATGFEWEPAAPLALLPAAYELRSGAGWVPLSIPPGESFEGSVVVPSGG